MWAKIYNLERGQNTEIWLKRPTPGALSGLPGLAPSAPWIINSPCVYYFLALTTHLSFTLLFLHAYTTERLLKLPA